MSFVYVVTDGAGLTKIGISSNPASRLRSLQTASSSRLVMPFQISTPYAFEIEQEAHSILGAYRVSGEWFMVNKEMAVAAIFGAASRLGYSLTEEAPRPLMTRGRVWFWFKVAIFAYFLIFMFANAFAFASEAQFPNLTILQQFCGPYVHGRQQPCVGKNLEAWKLKLYQFWVELPPERKPHCATMKTDFDFVACVSGVN